LKTKNVQILYHGVLQMLTMLTATVLIGQLAGISLPVTLFTTGLGCIIFTLVTKGRTPIGLGLSGSWLGTMITMSAFGLDHIVGATLLGGIFYVLFALLIKWKPQILKIFTPFILNLAVMFIALNLIGTGVGLVMAAPLTGIATIIGIAVFNQFKRTKQFAFPLGILTGTAVHAATVGLTSTMSGIFIPTLVAPAINTTTLAASLIFFALATEALGDSKLASDVTGNKYEPDKVILGNGIASIVSSFFGGMSVTTYSESCGYVRATGFAHGGAIIVAGLLFILMSFIPAVNYLIGFIPGAALAGMLLYLFSLVAATKISEAKAKNHDEELVAIIGISAFFLAPSLIPSISQIAVAMIAMVVTHLILQAINKIKRQLR
jgi:uracil permease